MNLVLFSSNGILADFCREALKESYGKDAELKVGLPPHLPVQGDFCLWDFVPGETVFPRDLATAELKKHLFLVHRKDLPELHDLVGTSDINVLLKPVTAATLHAFLDGSRPGRIHDGDSSKNADALRGERDEMLQFLIQANFKLQEYDQERTNFLARSIHDVRAPLTAISGYCGLLLEEELGPLTPEQRDVLGRMQNSASRLSRIASSMLQLGIRSTISRELHFEKADIRDCVDQALHEVGLFLEDKRITVSVKIEEHPDSLFFGKSQIEQTLVNLLDNAGKFTPRNGTIEIRAYPFFWERRSREGASLLLSQDRRVQEVRAPNSLRVDVCDSGPGIPVAHLSTIFEENTSYSGGDDRSGGGLGLAICRMILQRHGGKVWAESRNAGAVFSFVLPYRAIDTLVHAGRNGSATPCAPGTEERRG